MQGIERKPEPRFLAGIEHQCMIGFICRASPIVANVSTASRFLLLETARGADYRFLLSIRGAPFRRCEPTLLKPTLKGAPSYNALTQISDHTFCWRGRLKRFRHSDRRGQVPIV